MNSSLSQLITSADLLADTPEDWSKRVNVALNRRRIIDQCKSLIDWAVATEPVSNTYLSLKKRNLSGEFYNEEGLSFAENSDYL